MVDESTKGARRNEHGDRRAAERRLLHAWFADHARVAADTSLFVSQRLMSSFLVWLMVGVALTLPGLLWIAQSSESLSAQWPGSTALTVYMKLAASEQRS